MTWVTKTWVECNGTRPDSSASCPARVGVVADTQKAAVRRTLGRTGWTAAPVVKPVRDYCPSCTARRVWEKAGAPAGEPIAQTGDEIREALREGESSQRHRAVSCLLGSGYNTVEMVAAATDEDLLDIKNLGPGLLALIRETIPADDPVAPRGDEIREAIGSGGTPQHNYAVNYLIAAGYDTVAKVAAATDHDLLKIKNIGPTLLALVREAIPAGGSEGAAG